MRTLLSAAVVFVSLIMFQQEASADILYNFTNHTAYQQDTSDGSEWVISGTIGLNDNTFDSAPTGKELSLSDFVFWNFTVTKTAGPGSVTSASASWTSDTGDDPDSGVFTYNDNGIFATPTELQVFTNNTKEDVKFESAADTVNIHYHDNNNPGSRRYDGGIFGNNEWRTGVTTSPLSPTDSQGMVIATAIPEPGTLSILAVIGMCVSLCRRRGL